MSEFNNLKLDVENEIAVLTISRPAALNALNSETLDELNTALTEIEGRDDIKVVILTGGPDKKDNAFKSFVAGADIAEMVNFTAPEARAFGIRASVPFFKLMNMRQVTIAAVNGEEQSDVTLDDIKKLTFTYTDREGNETEVALSDIAQFEEGYTLGTINRDAQTRYISVTAGVDDDHNVSLLSNEIQKELDKIDLPEGYSIEMAGEDEMIADAMNQLYLMLLLAVIFIYLVMVAQFQSLLSPFIIMFTIPLAFTGGLFALYFTGNEVSVVAMIGFVMLAGIIVNNGIVMVDFINQLRRGGMEKKDAIIESGKTRLRPILMTALTTILSMSTMAVGLGEGSEMMQPMAIVTVGGLLYGTLLTLIVVPCIYDAFNRNKSMVEEDL